MSAAITALIAENSVIALAILVGWSLLRQGGGVQVKPVPVPKRTPEPKREPQAEADETVPLPKVKAA